MAQSASDFGDQLMSISTKTIFDDWTWKVFGYKKRPKRGAFFNRFVSEPKLIRETFLIREFFLSSCASGLVSLPRKYPKEFCLKIGKYIIDSLLSVDGTVKAFRFTSQKEARDYLEEGLNNYLETEFDSFVTVFFKRAQTYTEGNFKASWLVYISRLVTDYQSPLVVIRKTTLEKFNVEFDDDISA
jgi:hypothetical protein